MGKKPLLGLAAMCLGLTLSGCKDCNCGGGHSSRKHENVPVARQEKKADATPADAEVTDAQGRQRSAPNTTQPRAFDYPADKWDVTTTKTAGVKPDAAAEIKPMMPHAGADIAPAGKFETIADTKSPMHEVTGQKPISKADAKAAGIDPTDMVDVPGETAKKPTTAQFKEAPTAPDALPKEPGALPVVVEPKQSLKPVTPPVESIDAIPPAPPVGGPKVAPAKEVKSVPEAVAPVMPEPMPVPPSVDMKPAAVVPSKSVVETKSIPVPEVPDPVPPPPPTDVKSGGPELEPPGGPPVPMTPPAPPTPPGM